MKKILIGIALVVIVVLTLATMSMPDKMAHYEAVKKCLFTVVNREIDRHPLFEQNGTIVTVMALNATDEYLRRYLLVYDHTFYSTGVILYKDMFIFASVGVFGHVFLTVDEEDLERFAGRLDVVKMLGVDH